VKTKNNIKPFECKELYCGKGKELRKKISDSKFFFNDEIFAVKF